MAGPKYPKIVGFELVEQIGGGGFATVFRAVNVAQHRVAACKLIMFTEETTEKERKTFDKEMRIHTALKHENVLEFMNAVIVELKHKLIYIPGIYMLLELASGGDLFDKIAANVGVSEEVAHLYFNQLIAGMHYIHEQGVCHRDLKPENLLLDAAGTLKITDFGLSAVFRLKESGKTRMLTERCGSLPYVAPELNSDRPYHAEPIDVWGVGVILFTLLAGNTPWDEPSAKSAEFRRYVSGEIFSEDPWCRIPYEAMSLIKGMLTVDPEKRLTLRDVFQHSWVMRPSQLASSRNPAELAMRLTQNLRENGDLGLAAPNFTGKSDDAMDVDGPSAHKSQFTQSLMLFSQTQHGSRYTPNLTRFYSSLGPSLLIALIKEYLEQPDVGVKCKLGAEPIVNERGIEVYRMRIGGWDARKQMFKGWVDVEKFAYRGEEGAFCLMRRDEGSPISWRQLWKAIILSPAVEPHVLRK
ncbi:Serine/threonine-protein kinase CHK1 [Psilocybe cubensis]|uniref:Protein kinase domain-containing protein n=2 Tax=Psilocybe cubensis TaxID=181762 RepID=A0A8H8CR91_PSICU|nr:Serine/threonine-protein kinase CHK1 [Psilocybe cubensis]KAH9487412.1 Serine/threonine-protein kinase CHK1 [Psilocybe cubensis]